MDQKFNMEAFVDKIAKGEFGMLSVIAACSLDANNVEKFIDYLGQQACIDARLSTQHMLGESLYNEIVELYGRLPEDKKSYTTGKFLFKLTPKQKKVLQIMRSTEETIVFSKGGGCILCFVALCGIEPHRPVCKTGIPPLYAGAKKWTTYDGPILIKLAGVRICRHGERLSYCMPVTHQWTVPADIDPDLPGFVYVQFILPVHEPLYFPMVL